MYEPYIYSPTEIKLLLEKGKKNGASHLLICLDRFDYNEWHVFVINEPLEQVIQKYHKPENMQETCEIYEISTGKKLALSDMNNGKCQNS